MTISSHGENADPLPDGDPDRLRRLSVDDIFHLGSFALWAGPILAFLVVLLVIQDYAGETVDAADRASPRFRSRDHVHYSYAANIIVMLYSTLSYASWATFLRLRNVRHAELYAVTGWLLARVAWWLTLPIFGHVFMQIYADRLPMFGGGWGILAVSLLAAAGALRAIAAAYKGETTTRVWSNLVLAAPFAAMGMITLNISNVAAWAVTIIAVEVTAPSFFALASLIHGARARAKRTWAGARPPLSLLERLKRFAAIITLTGTLIAVVSAADFAWELTDQEYSTLGLLVNWGIIAIATASVYVSVVRAFGKERARKWAAATGMISIGIVLLPPVIFQAPDQLKPDAWFEGMVVGDWYVRLVLSRINYEIVSPCGIALMLLILVASLGLGFLRSARPFMAASALPALFFFSLAKPPLTSPPHQLDLVYWAEPTIVLIAVCAIIFVVFGEDGGHSRREYPTSATADA